MENEKVIITKRETWTDYHEIDKFHIYFIDAQKNKAIYVVNGMNGIFWDAKDYNGFLKESRQGYYKKIESKKINKQFNEIQDAMIYMLHEYSDSNSTIPRIKSVWDK